MFMNLVLLSGCRQPNNLRTKKGVSSVSKTIESLTSSIHSRILLKMGMSMLLKTKKDWLGVCFTLCIFGFFPEDFFR